MSNGTDRWRLKKEIRFRQLFTYVIGFMIGFGWIVMTGPWIKTAGAGGAAVALIAGGLLLIPIALCYVEVAMMFPYPGGEFVYAYQAFGSGMAFVAGWILLFLFISLTAFETIATAWIVTTLIPTLSGSVLYEAFGFRLTSGMLVIMAIGVLSLTWIDYRGGGSMALAQDLITFVLITTTLAIIIGGIRYGEITNLKPFLYSAKPYWWLFGVLSVFITTVVRKNSIGTIVLPITRCYTPY